MSNHPSNQHNLFRRHGPVWIFGRVAILIVFGIMPLIHVRRMIKVAPLREAYTKCMAAYDEANKYPVLSEGWNTNRAVGDHWHNVQIKLFEEIYGKEKSE